jgi:hypothetical protein
MFFLLSNGFSTLAEASSPASTNARRTVLFDTCTLRSVLSFLLALTAVSSSPDVTDLAKNLLFWLDSFGGWPGLAVETLGRSAFLTFCTVERLTLTVAAIFLSLNPLSTWERIEFRRSADIGFIVMKVSKNITSVWRNVVVKLEEESGGS